MPERQLKIMVVDDHAAFRGVVKAMVQTAGWKCFECQDGQEAVDTYAQIKPDLILMDIAMKPLDGLSATAQISARYPGAQIMILTQYDEPDLRAAASNAGACGYILKENLLVLPCAIAKQVPAATTGPASGSNTAAN